MSFDRSKIIAILTGALSLLLGITYLILVQVLDARGGMVPAPTGSLCGAAIHWDWQPPTLSCNSGIFKLR